MADSRLVLEHISAAVQAEKRCAEGQSTWKKIWPEVIDELGKLLAGAIYPVHAFEIVDATDTKVILHFGFTITGEYDTAIYDVKVVVRPTFTGLDYTTTLRGKCTYQARKIWNDAKDYVDSMVFDMLHVVISDADYRDRVTGCILQEQEAQHGQA